MTQQRDQHELFEDMATLLADTLAAKGVEHQRALDAAWEAAEQVRSHWGGQQIYIPKGTWLEVSRRHQEYYERWNKGAEVAELAAEAGIAVPSMYHIIRRIRKLRQKAMQPGLFDQSELERPLEEGA